MVIMRISYHTRSDNKDHTNWQVSTIDLDKRDDKGNIVEYTLDSGSKIDVDSLTLEFDAHGKNADEYDLSNLNVRVKFW